MPKVPDLSMMPCNAADCQNDLHSFNTREYKVRSSKHDRNFLEQGVCKACGTEPPFEWDQVHSRSVENMDYVFEALRHEPFRNLAWTIPFSPRAVEHASRMDRSELREQVRPTLKRIIGPIGRGMYSFKQVPTSQDKLRTVIQYAQHGVAACCRRCTQWHGIANDHELDDKELDYLSTLVIGYIDRRLP